jgi:hypothetical protein
VVAVPELAVKVYVSASETVIEYPELSAKTDVENPSKP